MLASLSSVPFDQLPATLEKLIDVIIQHFINEEAVCAKKGYNMTEDHKAVHRRLTEELVVMKAGLYAPDADLSGHPITLQNMLKTHILECDRFLIWPDPLAS